MRTSARACSLLVAVAVATTSIPIASAQTTAEIAAARELFEEGLKLEDKGQWNEALERFKKVSAVKMTPQVRFHIALCLENTGKLVDALVEFQRAQSDAASDSTASVVASNAGKHVADLKERIPRVVVKVPSGIDGITVTIDDAPVSGGLTGTPIPLDPGAHKIVVQAPTRTTFTKNVELVERGKVVTVEASLPSAEANNDVVGDDKKDDKPEPTKSGGAGPLPWIFGGLGVAALAGGGVLHLLARGTVSDLEEACGPNRSACPESMRDTAERGKTYSTYGNVLLGVGVLGVATAAVLFIVAPSSTEKTTSRVPAFSVAGGPSNFAFTLSGAF
jgi:hypothetical protein